MDIYLVGGAVRDQLLGLTVTEQDWVVVGATAEQLIKQGYRQVGKDFPVFLHPQTGEEYALARTERKTGKGYTAFECHAEPDVTLEDDLLRRDLTINAIAQTPDGKLIDPYGGQDDLKHKLLRHVSDAFVEDPLRILRVARFAARLHSQGFTVADETMRLMREMVRSGEVEALVTERVWREMQRSLAAANPEIFFHVLRQCGALAVLFPELDNLYGVPNPPKWHPEIDSGVHTMMVLQQAVALSKDPKIRFAALLHDLGKAITPITIWPSHHGHDDCGVELITEFCHRHKVPKEYQQLAELAGKYHILAHRVEELTPEKILSVLDALDAYRRPNRLTEFLLVCEADVRGRTGFETEPYQQAKIWHNIYNITQQVDIQGIIASGKQGPDIKQELNRQRVAIISESLKG